MNSKLTILADGKPLALKEDASISIELKNPLFNDNEMFSYPVVARRRQPTFPQKRG